MRALVFDQKIRFDPNYPNPVPADDQCLIRVDLTGVCATDLQITRGYLNFSGVIGHEFVGTVLEGSKEWQGKRVVCEINCVCGRCEMCQSGLRNHCRRRTVIGIKGRDGCFADLITVPQSNLHEVPDALTNEQAVFVEPLAAAYQVLVQCRIEKRMNVTVVGPGRLGLLVAQVLKTTGCKLTAVGRNRAKLLQCEKHGVQSIHVDDLTTRGDRDIVVDCTGSPEGLNLSLKLIRPRGTIVLKSTYAGSGGPDLAQLVIKEVNLLGSRCGPFPDAIDALTREAVEVRSMITRVFPIAQANEALTAAADPSNMKILIKPNS